MLSTKALHLTLWFHYLSWMFLLQGDNGKDQASEGKTLLPILQTPSCTPLHDNNGTHTKLLPDL